MVSDTVGKLFVISQNENTESPNEKQLKVYVNNLMSGLKENQYFE